MVGDHLVPWDYKDGDVETPNDGRVAMVHNGFRMIYQDRVESQNPDLADLPTPRQASHADNIVNSQNCQHYYELMRLLGTFVEGRTVSPIIQSFLSTILIFA